MPSTPGSTGASRVLAGHWLTFPVRSEFDRAAEWTSHRAVRSPPSAEPLCEASDVAERSVREQTRDDWCRCETGRLRQTVLLTKQADQKGAAR